MDSNSNIIQLRTSSDNIPAIATAQALAEIRMDERRYPHYKRIAMRDRVAWLANQVKYLASIARLRDFDAREAVLTATALDEMICTDSDMMELTLPEIADAFKSGVFGKYGEFYGLSAPNLYGFLDKFLASEKKKEASAMVLKSREQSYDERKAAEKEEMQRRIRAEIEEAKRNGSFVPTGRVWFQPKTVDDAMSSREHMERVRMQAREILGSNEHYEP